MTLKCLKSENWSGEGWSGSSPISTVDLSKIMWSVISKATTTTHMIAPILQIWCFLYWMYQIEKPKPDWAHSENVIEYFLYWMNSSNKVHDCVGLRLQCSAELGTGVRTINGLTNKTKTWSYVWASSFGNRTQNVHSMENELFLVRKTNDLHSDR